MEREWYVCFLHWVWFDLELFVVCVKFKQVLDLYDEHRSLHRAGNLARKAEKEVGTTWWDLHVALLDHYRTPPPPFHHLL